MKLFKTLFFLLLSSTSLIAQDDLDDMLDGMEENTTDYVSATFKSTRVINLHTVELVAPKTLDMRISHRFGSLDGGAYEFFGLDQATMRLGLEYGIRKNIMVGLGRSTYQKTLDGFVKGKILRQSRGLKTMPLSLVYFGSFAINGLKWAYPERENYFSSRLVYVHQVILARKFSESLSLQLSPTVIHRNLVPTALDQNTSYAMGFSGRMKINKRTSINAEYIYRIPPENSTSSYSDYYNSLSIGMDIETGGHVFSLHLSNSAPMMEHGYILETNKTWGKGGIHFGFNISREFTLKK